MTNVPHNYNSELKIDGIDGDNKLHEAIKNGNLLPELFANNYYLINIPNRSGLTPLDLAQKMGVSLTGVLLAAKVIMESKNQPADTISHNMNFLSSSILNQNPEQKLQSALNQAMDGHYEELVNLVKEYGSKILDTEISGNKKVALHVAIEREKSGVIAKLLELGANPNKQDIRGNTAAHNAAAIFGRQNSETSLQKSEELLSPFFESDRFDPSITNNQGQTVFNQLFSINNSRISNQLMQNLLASLTAKFLHLSPNDLYQLSSTNTDNNIRSRIDPTRYNSLEEALQTSSQYSSQIFPNQNNIQDLFTSTLSSLRNIGFSNNDSPRTSFSPTDANRVNHGQDFPSSRH